jgi:hypothetical protein
MTTQCVHIRTLLFIASIAVAALPLFVHAQTEDILTTGEDVSVNTDAGEDLVAPVVVEAEAPWFRVEKLNGENQAIGDFVVGPGRAEIEVRPGESVTYEISVANRISDDRTFELAVEDVAGSADASLSVVLLGEATGPYTLKDYISFPKDSFTLDLGERARIPVTITMPKNAAPGGYYGSVLISTVRIDETEQEGVTTRSPIIARIGTLFFITVPGEVERSGELKELSLKNKRWWYEKGPIDFTILYENTGSVHLNPYGELRIKNLFGEEVGFVELEPWFALPKSLRSREVTWDREVLFGRYVATIQLNRGYDDIVDEVSVAFWVLPWKVLGGTFLVIFLVFLGLRFFFRTFEFKRKT